MVRVPRFGDITQIYVPLPHTADHGGVYYDIPAFMEEEAFTADNAVLRFYGYVCCGIFG